jgi:hypothetical protein
MNTHVRDQLKSVWAQLKGFAFSSGEGNDAGGGDTQLTSYDVSIPADALAEAGNALLVEGTFVVGSGGGTKTAKLKVGSGTAVTIISTTGTSDIVPFRMLIRRRTSTTGSLTGIAYVGAPAAGAPTNYLANATTGTVAWGSLQTLAVYAAATDADDMKLSDYNVTLLQGAGATV